MNWPARTIPETMALLTAPGAFFETTPVTAHGRTVRAYVRAKPHLRAVFDESRRFGVRDFLIFENERVSFEAHWRAATAFGHALIARYGVRKGERVAVAMRNFPEWSICAWGALAVGAVLVPLNAWEPGAVLARMIADSGAKVVVLDGERLERIKGLVASDVALIVTRSDAPGAEPLAGIIGAAENFLTLPDRPLPDPGLSPDDPATIFYTSGTTGQAKGAFGSHRNVTTNIVNIAFRPARAALRRGGEWAPPADDAPPRVQLLPMPFFHVTGFQSSLAPAMANGATIALMYKWDAQAALTLIEREQIKALTLVPSQAEQLVEAAARGGHDLSAVDSFGYGGASASPGLAARARAEFANAFPGQGYGATETSSLSAANSHEDMIARPGSVGTAVPCCDIRIVGEDGRDAPLGAPGEVLVSGPNVVIGYWNAPEATAAAFEGGWYRTGDIARMDEEGFITILDRAKDMLIRGGENIYCVEIEDALASHPAVAEAAVFGAPDAILGEIVAANVRLKPGERADPAALKAHAGAQLAAHKIPVILDLRDEPFPRNAAGKALKRELRAETLARHGLAPDAGLTTAKS